MHKNKHSASSAECLFKHILLWLNSNLKIVQTETAIIQNVEGRGTATTATMAYTLPAGYTPICAIPYTSILTWYSQLTLVSFTTTNVVVTVFNGYGSPQTVYAAAHVICAKT